MGAGAGYKITTKDIYVEGQVTSAKIIGKDYLGDPLILCDCDMRGKAGSLRASSYMYSTEEIEDVDFVVTKALISVNGDEEAEEIVNDNKELAEIIKDDLERGSIEFVYDGGYVHSAWDGTICSVEDSIKNSKRTDYNFYMIDDAYYVAAVDATVTDKKIIDYVDKAVQGENFEEQYVVYDEDSNIVDEYDKKEDAIEECKKHGVGSYVEKVQYYYDSNGDFDLDTFDTRHEVVYEKEEADESLTESADNDISSAVNGKVIDFGDNGYYYVNYDGYTLQAGSATNNGFMVEYEIDYDHDKSIDANLNDLYDKIIEEHPEYVTESVNGKYCTVERFNEKLNEDLEDGLRVREWYVSAFPNDELGWEINADATFDGVQKAIDEGADVYALLEVNDSLIRERVFDKLSDITGVPYDDIFEKWVNGSDESKKRARDELIAFDN